MLSLINPCKMQQFLLLSATLLGLWSQIPYALADDDGLDPPTTEFGKKVHHKLAL